MKKLIAALILLTVALAALPRAEAALVIPGADGYDGPLNITNDTKIDLSRAVTAAWNATNAGSATRGVYDTNKWAVVFRYTSVNIAPGATLTFSNHPSRAPVVWLVNGNVTNAGAIRLDGENATVNNVRSPEPGPGGFRGGNFEPVTGAWGSGFGPGGDSTFGVYGTGSLIYGNPEIVPLIGGSGGHPYNQNGAAGGGAILIAVAGTVMLPGGAVISANGGGDPTGNAYAGSGGAVRIVADSVLGSGKIEAKGVLGLGYAGGTGRTRLEATVASPDLEVNPTTVAVPPGTVTIWPSATAPTVRVMSIDALPAPGDPRANIVASGDDLRISTVTTNVIELQTSNFPLTGHVKVFIKPRIGNQTILEASFFSGNASLATWRVLTVLPPSHTVIQARAVAP